MSEFYIRKKISLDFVGEDYKDAYLVFKTVPVKEYEKLFEDAKRKDMSNIDAAKLALTTIKSKFIEGKFPDVNGKLVDVSVDDLESFMDEETLNVCYLTILGQKSDPKLLAP